MVIEKTQHMITSYSEVDSFAYRYTSESSSCYPFSPSIKFPPHTLPIPGTAFSPFRLTVLKGSGSADQLSMRTRGGMPLDIIQIRNLPSSGSTG